MKLFSAALVLTGMAMPNLVSAQTLEEKWNLEEPSFSYEDKTVELTFSFSENVRNTGMTEADLYLYSDFTDNNSLNNCRNTDLTANNVYVGTALDIDEEKFVFDADADYEERQSESVTIAIDTELVQDESSIFTDFNNGTNRIAFCVRYGLWTAPGGYEVNFLETLIEVRVDLTGDFNITDVFVAPKDRLKRTANTEYGLIAYQCTGKNDATTAGIPRGDNVTFNQGDVITVCVEPDSIARDDDVYMREVTRFEYIKLESDGSKSDSIRQMAIDTDDDDAGTRGAMFGLTNIDNCRGDIACLIETILFATFFARPGTVIGEGSATMQFGTDTTRRLRGEEERSLQVDEAAAGDFDLNFQIANNDAFERDSGASGISLSILALLGTTAAALML